MENIIIQINTVTTMRALVVYYSRTGNTRKVAEDIAKELQCDKEEIVDTVNRSGPIGWVNSGRQASQGTMTKLQPLKNDPSQYDIVIIGSPVWAGHVSTPVRTYLAENKDKIKKAAFFITMGGRGDDTTSADMESLGGKKPISKLVIKTADIKKGDIGEAVKQFTSEISSR
jgi:flavodoxin